jgi:hypothetical protein
MNASVLLPGGVVGEVASHHACQLPPDLAQVGPAKPAARFRIHAPSRVHDPLAQPFDFLRRGCLDREPCRVGRRLLLAAFTTQ